MITHAVFTTCCCPIGFAERLRRRDKFAKHLGVSSQALLGPKRIRSLQISPLLLDPSPIIQAWNISKLGNGLTMAKIELNDQGGGYRYGKLKAGGKIELYDQQGNYFYGKLKDNGKIELYDSGGN